MTKEWMDGWMNVVKKKTKKRQREMKGPGSEIGKKGDKFKTCCQLSSVSQ